MKKLFPLITAVLVTAALSYGAPLVISVAEKSMIVVKEIDRITTQVTIPGPQGPSGGGAGSGDMAKSVYDPTGINGSPFDRANHTGYQPITSVTGLRAALAGKAAASHTQAATTITEDSTHRFVTDSEKSTWTGKQDLLVNASSLGKISESGGAPTWNGSAWPGGSGGPVAWADITGDINLNTALQEQLATKLPAEHIDTDSSAISIHHTLGTGEYQSAAGNHGHAHSATTGRDAADQHPRGAITGLNPAMLNLSSAIQARPTAAEVAAGYHNKAAQTTYSTARAADWATLGDAATKNVGTTAGTVAAGDKGITSDERSKLSSKKYGNFYFSFTPYATPILTGTRHRLDPSSIIRVDDTYYMYYTRLKAGTDLSGSWENILDGAEIWYATAPALIGPWTEQAAVITPNTGNAAAWDYNCVFTPEIVVDGSTYNLLFNAMNGSALSTNKDGIGVATSSSPSGPFTKYASNPIISTSSTPGDFDYLKANGGSIVNLPNGKKRIYYKVRPSVATTNRTITYAELPAGQAIASSSWVKHGSPILGYGVDGSTVEYEDPGVTIINGRFYMMVNRMSGNNIEEAIWLESTDGITGWINSESFQPLYDDNFEATWARGIHLGFSTAANGLNYDLQAMTFAAAGDYSAGDFHSIGLVLVNPMQGDPVASGNDTEITADTVNNLSTQASQFYTTLWRNGLPYAYSLSDILAADTDNNTLDITHSPTTNFLKYTTDHRLNVNCATPTGTLCIERVAASGPTSAFFRNSATTAIESAGTTFATLNWDTTDNNWSQISFGSKTLDGTAYGGALIGAQYTSHANGAPTTDIVVALTNGSVSPTEKMRLTSDGRLRLTNQPAAPTSGVTACTVGDMILEASGRRLWLCYSTPNSWASISFSP